MYHEDLLSPFQEHVVTFILQSLPRSSDQVLEQLLEILTHTIKINVHAMQKYQYELCGVVVDIWSSHKEDGVIMNELSDLVATMASGLDLDVLFPHLVGVLISGSNTIVAVLSCLSIF